MGCQKPIRRRREAMRHNPLDRQIVEEEQSLGLRKTPRVKRRDEAKDEEGEEALTSSMSKKVLEVAQAQKTEDDRVNRGYADFDDMPDDVDIEEVEEEIDLEVDEEGFMVMQGAS